MFKIGRIGSSAMRAVRTAPSRAQPLCSLADRATMNKYPSCVVSSDQLTIRVAPRTSSGRTTRGAETDGEGFSQTMREVSKGSRKLVLYVEKWDLMPKMKQNKSSSF